MMFDRTATPNDAENDPARGGSPENPLIATLIPRRAPALSSASTRTNSPATSGSTLQETAPATAVIVLTFARVANRTTATAATNVGSPRSNPSADAEMRTAPAIPMPQAARSPSVESSGISTLSSVLPFRVSLEINLSIRKVTAMDISDGKRNTFNQGMRGGR